MVIVKMNTKTSKSKPVSRRKNFQGKSQNSWISHLKKIKTAFAKFHVYRHPTHFVKMV